MPSLQTSFWPIRPKPIPGEVLSSWLSRIARDTGLTFQELKKLLPREPQTGVDFDWVASQDLFEILSSVTGTPVEIIWATSYEMDRGRIFDNLGTGKQDWIIPTLRRRNNPSRALSMPFCPTCLASDNIPYYRKCWRYAFYPVCPQHGFLWQKCPECGMPFCYLETDKKGQMILSSGHLAKCRHCGMRYTSQTDVGPAETVLASITGIQSQILSGLDDGWINIEGWGSVPMLLFLKGLRALTTMALRPDIGQQITHWCASRLDPTLSDTIFRQRYITIEKATPQLRCQALRIADALIQEWPSRFMMMVDQLDLSLHETLPTFSKLPFWMSGSDIARLKKSTRHYSVEELDAARRLLAKTRKWAPNSKELQQFHETSIAPPIRPLTRPASANSKKLLQELEQSKKIKRDRGRTVNLSVESKESIAASDLLKSLHDGTERLSALRSFDRKQRSRPDE